MGSASSPSSHSDHLFYRLKKKNPQEADVFLLPLFRSHVILIFTYFIYWTK
uniref:Uncharacterized protein n=1 Tax=Rhizophora mucronata TaxID=61149 RepID=A0A2P2PPJ0_RHIMU